MNAVISPVFRFKLKLLAALCVLCIFLNSGCNRKGGGKVKQVSVSESNVQDLLTYLPPVLSAKSNTDTQSLLLTTTDLARYEDRQEAKPYVQSIQIVDADAPWPPRWYSSLPVYTDEMHKKLVADNQFIYNFIMDAKVEGGYLTFYKIVSKQDLKISPLKKPEISGHILLDKNYNAVDTVTAAGQKRRNLFYHDFRINDRQERIIDIRKDTYLDLRDYTDNDKDSTVHCYVDYIMIVDSNNKTLFSWNPMEHINPDLFQFNTSLGSKSMATLRTDILECTRLTSAVFDFDGDILYSMREIGIGKISRKDGHIIWHIDYTEIPIVDGKDTIEWYSPHDINPVADNANSTTYSVYSDGKKNTEKTASAVIFEVNKKTFEVKLVKVIKPYVSYIARGHGNIDYSYKTGNYLMSYGNLSDKDDGPDFRIGFEYGTKDSVVGLYQIPKFNSAYKVHRLDNWPRPPRPTIVKNGDLLEANGEMTDWTWYKLSGKNNTTIEMAGKGKTIKPQAGVTYCVEGKYGIGFSVSRAFVNE